MARSQFVWYYNEIDLDTVINIVRVDTVLSRGNDCYSDAIDIEYED